nr:hypothetical protein [Synechococcus sp. AH-779-G23]
MQSASASRQDQLQASPSKAAIEAWELIKPGWIAFHTGDHQAAEKLWSIALSSYESELLLLRVVNQYAPHLIQTRNPRLKRTPFGNRIAVILAGEMRCLKQNKSLFQALHRHADIFVCTSKPFSQQVFFAHADLAVIEPEPLLPTGAMQQWHKFHKALKMVRAREQKLGKRYTHILKLRTDFHHSQPRYLLKELTESEGLICASDKVFGGRRELMLLFEGFHPAISSTFDNRELRYWPINIEPILRSDYSHKWYGMPFPKAIVGEPNSVEELRNILEEGGSCLSNKLLTWKDDNDINTDNYVRFFKGNSRFASEVCFARFLNFNAIPTHSCSSLTGFLRNDRFTP